MVAGLVKWGAAKGARKGSGIEKAGVDSTRAHDGVCGGGGRWKGGGSTARDPRVALRPRVTAARETGGATSTVRLIKREREDEAGKE